MGLNVKKWGTIVTTLMLLSLMNCKKKESCAFDPCLLKASSEEVANVKAYLNSKSIVALEHCSGAFYKIEVEGQGVQPANACAYVGVKYKGTFTNGTQFDQSSATVSFSLANLITGWKNIIPLMKQGSKAMLYIPPSLGYGPNTYQGIPGNSILIFEIELVKVH